MNKLTKGAVAGAAGISLLLGGAGTFALWNDTASASMGTISSGTLDISNVSAAVWTDSATGVVIPDISTFALVPGDTITYTQTVSVAATGNNLTAELALDPSGMVAGWTPGSDELYDALTVDVKANGTTMAVGTPITVSGPSQDFVITADITMKDVGGQVAQGKSIDLSGLAFSLTQVRP